VLSTIEAEGASSAAEAAMPSFYLALRERDPAAAARALAKIPPRFEKIVASLAPNKVSP